MRRGVFVLISVAASLVPGGEFRFDTPSSRLHWGSGTALAQAGEASAKEAFEAARELGTLDAWDAFLANFPRGFYADLARAYRKQLGAEARPDQQQPAPQGRPAPPAPRQAAPRDPGAKAPVAASADKGGDFAADLAPTDPTRPAIQRAGVYMGFQEQFNRYYTDPGWKPSRVVYVSPDGTGNGSSRNAPAPAQAAVAAARPGTLVYFLRGRYQACFEFTKANGGSYDAPVVVYAERNPDRSLGVAITCCGSGRQTCFNLEAADYVAVDGFELSGGQYGVRAVGADFAASAHQRGIAVIDNFGHDQNRDPFFSGQSDWAVWERNVATGAKAGDGHGIYLSNGSDWNIVRFNETHSNVSSDFQINADPQSTCKEVGIAFDDPQCSAYAGTGEGGRGASDYFLVDGNFFHHGLASGANFTSVRRSVVRNNVFGIYPRHGVSFWQETDNPELGSSDNRIVNNLFVTTGRQAVQFVNNSTRNLFANNVLVGAQIARGQVTANPAAVLMEVDATVGDNLYQGNVYLSGKLEGRKPNGQEIARADLSPAWFKAFPVALNRDPGDFALTPSAPFRKLAARSDYATADRAGAPRPARSDPGPVEAP